MRFIFRRKICTLEKIYKIYMYTFVYIFIYKFYMYKLSHMDGGYLKKGACVMNMYRLLFCDYSLNNTTKQQFTWYLHGLGILYNLG